MAPLISKPGITRLAVSSGIPKEWNQNWFRDFVSDYLKGADVRNAIGANGIKITGNITSPYATISIGGPGFPINGPLTINDVASTNDTTLTVNAFGTDAPAAGTGRAAVFRGQPNTYAAEVLGSATSGQSYGLFVRAGTTAADVAFQVNNDASTVAYLVVRGDGLLTASGVAIVKGGEVRNQLDSSFYSWYSTAGVRQGYLQSVAGLGFVLSSEIAGNFIDLRTTSISRFLIDAGGVVYHAQPTPTAVNATATLTIAQMLTLIITSTSAAATTMTLPTGTLTDAGIIGGTAAANISFDWSIINTGPSTVTLAAGTAHTIVGTTTTATLTSSRWRTRKTTTNTFVTYRLS